METYGQIVWSAWELRMETCGQIACAARFSEGWRPAVKSRARSGDYPSVSRWAQAARSGQTQGAAPTTIFAINYPDAVM